MTIETKRKVGRPRGSTKPKRPRIFARIDPDLMERIDKYAKSTAERSKFFENALIILVEVYEGKRKMPEVDPPENYEQPAE